MELVTAVAVIAGAVLIGSVMAIIAMADGVRVFAAHLKDGTIAIGVTVRWRGPIALVLSVGPFVVGIEVVRG